jgi:hypothetical protein
LSQSAALERKFQQQQHLYHEYCEDQRQKNRATKSRSMPSNISSIVPSKKREEAVNEVLHKAVDYLQRLDNRSGAVFKNDVRFFWKRYFSCSFVADWKFS